MFWLVEKESGIHRLVEFLHLTLVQRHTSFASIWVYPVVDENINIEILDKDLRIDAPRSVELEANIFLLLTCC